MEKFIVYTKNDCPYCVEAKKTLGMFGYEWEEHDLSDNDQRAQFYRDHGFSNEPGTSSEKRATMPKIWHGSTLVGGSSDLTEYLVDLE